MSENNLYRADFRASGHKARVYFGAFMPDVVLNASVTATPADKALSLAISVNSGSAANVQRGFMVRVETAGGAVKGVTNVRAAGTISSTALPIRELGQADIQITSGDVVKVYNLPFLGDKLPADDITFAPDHVTYASQGSALAPHVLSGGHFLGFVDSGQTYATVPTLDRSSAEDEDSGGSLTHLWTLLTGTLAFAPGSSSSDASPTLRASVGYGLALHTVTDNSNSASWRQFVCTQVYDAEHPPYRLINCTLNADEMNGWNGDLETLAYSTLAELPDGQMGGVFLSETINGQRVSRGSAVPGRSHIKLIGFLHREENDLTAQIRRLRFSLQSPLARLASLPGFSKVFTRDASDWTLIEGLTIRRADLHLLHHYSFFTELFDVVFDANFLNKAYSQLFVNKQVAVEQLRELNEGVDARTVGIRTGELLIHTHPSLVPLGSRAAVDRTISLQERDIFRLNSVRDHWKTAEFVETRGFIAGATNNEAVFSRYPGLTPGRGSQSTTYDKQITDSQTENNERGGRRGARVDGTFIDAVGVQRRGQEVTLTLPGSYDVQDFYPEYTELDLDATTNPRGIDLRDFLFYPSRLSVRYTGGTARVEATLSTATNAPPAKTYVPPDTSGNIPWTPLPPIAPITPGPVFPGALLSGTKRMATVNVNGVGLTETWHYPAIAGGPLWYLPYSKPWSGTLIEWCPDGYNPGYGWVLTTTELGYLRLSDGTYVVKHTFAATSSNRSIDASYGENGFVAVASYYPSAGGMKVLHSTNNSSFTETTVNSFDGEVGTYSGIYVSPKTPGKIVVSVPTGLLTTVPYVSTDYGSSWSVLSPAFATPNVLGTWHIHAPFSQNGSDNIYFYSSEVNLLTGSHRFYRYTGGSNTEIAPQYSGERYMPFVPRNGSSSSIQNPNRMLIAGRRAEAGGPTFGLWLSNNVRAASGVLWSLLEIPGATGVRRCAISGDKPDEAFAWGNGYLKQITINGNAATLDDRLGNLASLSLGETIGLAGW